MSKTTLSYAFSKIMNKKHFLSLLISLFACLNLEASGNDSLNFQTQISLFGLLNPTNTVYVNSGGRIIPQLDYLRDFANDRRISAEVSANINLNADIGPSYLKFAGSMGLYRAWVRFSTQRNEIRAGLQQLNFGSASLLRPLQWFDGLNPTDPLRLTNGVWGILDRVYFKNNSTLWLWGLYGNPDKRVWDIAVHTASMPEFGFRFQQPVPMGEMAFSLNHRTVETTVGAASHYRETKIGLDGKWDVGPGLWFEDSFTATSQASPLHAGWNSLTVGSDLTPEFLDGWSFTFEHMLNTTYSNVTNSSNLSALSVTWPINIFHRISGIVLYSWESKYWFRYLTWSADFDRSSFYVIGFWNPNLTTSVLSLGSGSFSKYGFQLMYVLHL
ncbi:MAG: hypothetical protein NTY32_03780 [Bacteroidia bacterium]|nr:hypothetical protein [Bacteroidia bacterium]